MTIPQSPAGTRLDTSNNHGPLLFSTGWCMFALAALATGTRLGTRLVLVRRLAYDDLLIIASTVSALAYTITTTVAIANGAGKHEDTDSQSQLDALQKVMM
ncbi:MAG: hypothetical protein Q9227_002513 [Pyrenula ochraceoflavens]